LPAALLRRLLAHPLTASMQIDDPATTELRKQIVASKPFLKAIYDEWYQMLADELPAIDGKVLELGSGGGYCSQFIPELITSEAFPCSTVQLVADAQRMPFADGTLRAIVMTNVLHHLPDVREFLKEASRCLRSGGKILMIEPWVTSWSKVVYMRLHHEPFDPNSEGWAFPPRGPLSGANVAMPWIVFERDRAKFEAEFLELSIERIRPFMPFRYLVSGGVAMRNLMPGITHSAWLGFENLLKNQMSRLGMFALVAIRRA
jgi:SAM-dependent methyltransferase